MLYFALFAIVLDNRGKKNITLAATALQVKNSLIGQGADDVDVGVAVFLLTSRAVNMPFQVANHLFEQFDVHKIGVSVLEFIIKFIRSQGKGGVFKWPPRRILRCVGAVKIGFFPERPTTQKPPEKNGRW